MIDSFIHSLSPTHADEEVKTCEPIEQEKSIDQIKADSYNLPSGYKWVTMNVDDDLELTELYKLLTENYVEDTDNMFRFDYSPQFLRWALKPTNWKAEWHCGVRVDKSNKLVGFISGTPASVRVNEKVIPMVEINFLCVHKILRSKRMAPVLIKEITRRVNLHGIFQAVYTAGIVLPKPVGSCKYWHRSLNPKKLLSVKFSHLGRNMTLARTIKFYSLPDKTLLAGFRPMQPEDVDQVFKLLTDYLTKFDLVPIYSREEFVHWFTPQPDVVNSFVVEQAQETGDKKIVAFSSFYTLPSSVMHHPTYKNIKAAYSFYNVPSEHVELKSLVKDTLIAAKNLDYDVFNALDLMENDKFLEELKFGKGDGDLQYYLYNWKCPTLPASKIGLVLQ